MIYSIIYSTSGSYYGPSTLLGAEEIAVNITKWGQEYKNKYLQISDGDKCFILNIKQENKIESGVSC